MFNQNSLHNFEIIKLYKSKPFVRYKHVIYFTKILTLVAW